jgi:undecaprenyl-diphosphatase
MVIVPPLASISGRILSLHGWVALAIVFAVPALEASAFLGFLFPGEIAILLGGVLAYQGQVPLASVIVAAVAGAVIGDTIGYFVGRRWGRRILRSIGAKLPFIRHRIEEHLDGAEAYLKRRGGIAIFLGRFTAALRVMVPGLAGMAEMPYAEFVLFNALGGLIWGAGFVLLGYFAGAAWQRAAGDASKIGLGLLVVILVGLVTTRVLRGVRERGERAPDRLARLAPIVWIRERYPRLAGWLAVRVATSPRGFTTSFVVVAGAICGWVFGSIAQDVAANEEAVRSDPGIERFVVDHRTGWMTFAMKAVTWLGSNAILIPLVAIVVVYLVVRRREWWSAALLVGALAGANVLYRVAKSIFARPRPPASLRLMSVSGFSFPSGHATAAIACWGAVAIVLGRRLTTRGNVAMWSSVVLVALLVGLSRIYLGLHWWTDVLGGLALGGLWLSVLGLVRLLGATRAAVASDPSPPGAG